MKLVLEYLKNHSLKSLQDEYGVNFRFDKNRTKISLNYDTLSSRPGEPISDSCRGVVIRPNNITKTCKLPSSDDIAQNIILGDCSVLCYPMHRFYNYGDSACALTDLSAGSKIFEKLDGTMTALYFDPLCGWCVATRSIPEADVPINSFNYQVNSPETFSSIFWKTLENQISGDINSFISKLDKKYTYVFELTTIHNRIVVRYEQDKVTLIAARNIESGQEVPIEMFHDLGVPFPCQWNFDNFEQIEKFVSNLDPVEFEGVVVCDSSFNRAKVKSKAWILASRLKTSLGTSDRRLLGAIFENVIDDVIPLVPDQIKEHIEDMREKTRVYLSNIKKNFEEWSSRAVDDRSFALQVQVDKPPFQGIYFQLWRGKVPENDISLFFENGVKSGKISDKSLDSILFYISKEY